jgi:hypothetical protein
VITRLPPHRLDDLSQRANVHISAPLHLGDIRLSRAQPRGQFLLRQPAANPQLVQFHGHEQYLFLPCGRG